MCGIAGFYSKQNIFSEDSIYAMTKAMSHRGPDAEGHFISEGIALGHKRLSIIDLEKRANQPMVSACGRYQIVLNGEIYNFQEIANDLTVKLRTSSDTEVVLEAFIQWGPDFVNRLNGMFAMAIYDTKDAKLYLFRDRMGIKPLFYYLDNGNLAFASELKAFYVVKGLKQKLRMKFDSISGFLHLGYIPEPDTIWENVYKFPSGAYACFDGNNLQFNTYWKYTDLVGMQVLSDENIAKEQLHILLKESVEKRLIGDVPVGIFLSGGIDSSLLAAVAQSVSVNSLKTFSVGFKEGKYDESKYARQVAERIGTNHHEFVVSHKDALDLFDDILGYFDEPYADSSAIPVMLISELARKYVTVTLSGDGGDELFYGYGSYNWAKRLHNPVVRSLRKPTAFTLSKMSLRHQRASHLFRFKGKDIRSHIFSQEQYFFSQQEIADLLLKEKYLPWSERETTYDFQRKFSSVEKQAFFDLNYYLKDDLLTKIDRATMKYSLEDRVPMLDHNIVQFALNLSEKLKIKGGEQKYLLKQVLFDYLPRELFDRPKWGFSIPLQQWMSNELKPLVEDVLSDQNVKNANLVSPEFVKSIKQQYYSGKSYLYNRIWLLLVLHKWVMIHKTLS